MIWSFFFICFCAFFNKATKNSGDNVVQREAVKTSTATTIKIDDFTMSSMPYVIH